MWSKTEHCCKRLTAGFFIGTYYPSNLRIWTNCTKEPSNLVPGTCILVNVFILLQDLHFIGITQIAIWKNVMWAWTSKLVQVWERGIRKVIILRELYLFSCFSNAKNVSSGVHFLLLTVCSKKLLFQRWTSG